MKSFKYLQGKKDFDLIVREKPTPQPTGNQVLVRVAACGVCGTDIHILDRFSEYTALGHEIAATVEEIGDSVTKIRVGDAVVVEDVTFCGSCESCKNGRTDLCRNMYSLQGQSGMGEYLLVHENMLIPAAGVDPVAATLTEPLAVAINTFFATHLPAEGNLVIFGLGIQGILCAALARHYGAGTVICIGSKPGTARNARREAAAHEMGADAVLYSADPEYKRSIADLTAGRVDAVIVTSPPQTLPAALEVAGYGAPVVTIGVDMGDRSCVTLDVDRLIFNKNSIIPVFAEPARMFPLSLKLIRNKVIDTDKLITHRFPIASPSALKDLFANDLGVIKAVMVTEAYAR